MALIPAGFYRARARKDGAEFGTSKTGTDFVRVPFVFAEGDHKGQELTWDGHFGPESTKRTFESLQYCGCTFPNNDPTDLTGIDANEVSVEVEHQTYTKQDTGEEKTYARIAWVNSLSRGISPEAKMTEANKAAFKKRMMGQMLMVKKGAPASATAAPPANGGAAQRQLPQNVEEKTDIPF